MKNHTFILIFIPIFTLSTLRTLNGSEIPNSINTDEINEINRLNEEKNELLQEIRVCNALNIGISLFGLTSGISGIVGILLKDKVLELTGSIGSTVSATLLITTNCMQCCQNQSDDADNKDFGDL